MASRPSKKTKVAPVPDTPTPPVSAAPAHVVEDVGELGAPAIPVSTRSDTYSIKDPKKLTSEQKETLIQLRSDAIAKLYEETPEPSSEDILATLKKAEMLFFTSHLKAPFGGRKTLRKVRIPIKKNGDLTNLGYSMTKKARSRHSSIKKAVKKFGRATVSRKLNALAVLNKRRRPATARKARADRKYAMKV
jgi:hypothetical protein